jgi:hypothetical protein
MKANNDIRRIANTKKIQRPFKEIKEILSKPTFFSERTISPTSLKIRGAPIISSYRPEEIEPNSEVEICGYNLKGAKIMIDNKQSKIIFDDFQKLIVCAPSDISIGNKVDLLAWNRFGNDIEKNAFKVKAAKTPEFFTFSAPSNQYVKPSAPNQKYLVLMVLPTDKQLPAGLTEADMYADLTVKLSGPGKCANGFWQEATYGKTSFIFDIYNKVINLNNKWHDYYHPAEPKRVDGSGANYPVKFSGGETLDISGRAGFSVTITFSAGNQSLSDIINAINKGIDLAFKPSKPDEEVPIAAKNNNGQLRLETTETGSGATLAVNGGSAIPLLGLSAPTVAAGVEELDKQYEVMVEALEKRTFGLSDSDAQVFLDGYNGLIVSHAGSETYYRANAFGWFFKIRGGSVNVQLPTVYITNYYPWQVFAHEIGHNLGLPDLYDEPGGPELVGVELDRWDIMDCSAFDCHPCAWCKTTRSYKPGSNEQGYNDPWMTAIELITPPPQNTNLKREVLLMPTSMKIPPINPFAGIYPGLPLVHAIRCEFDPNHSIFVEAREKGPWSIATLGNASYDSDIPAEGVIVTDCINDVSILQIYRHSAVLLTPMDNPINTIGEEHVEPVTAINNIKIMCKEIIGSNPAVYKIETLWGPGSFFDLRINPWVPPPWESSDIWIDNQVDNDWDEYKHSDPALNPDVAGHPVRNGDRARVNWPHRLYARVWNDGDTDAKNVQVRFSLVIPPGSGPGAFIDSATIPLIKAGSFGLAQVIWTPRSTNEQHCCIQVEVIHQTGELNASNNMAQTNITDWFIESSSPYETIEFPFQVQNPLPTRAHFHLNAQGLRAGYHVDVLSVDFWLNPSEIKICEARIWLENGVPYESRDSPAPLISLEWQVHYGCEWIPFGGISGWAHAVERASVDAVFDHPKLYVTAKTSSGPIRGANVTVRLLTLAEEVVLITRSKTDSSGMAQFQLDLPSRYSTSDEYRAEVVLSPTLGKGPAETLIKIVFK